MSKTHQQIKLYYGADYISLFLGQASLKKLQTALTSKASDWVEVTQSSGNKMNIKSSMVTAVEFIEAKTALKNKDTIPVKTLADFVGVSPITITRNFSDTLQQQGKIKRATKDTAKALHQHLSNSDKNIPKLSAVMKLFN